MPHLLPDGMVIPGRGGLNFRIVLSIQYGATDDCRDAVVTETGQTVLTEPGELTERQLEVLERIVEHKSYKEIAADLEISETRVKQHVRALKDRLGANSMSELVASFHGLLQDRPFTNWEGPKTEVPPPAAEQASQFADDPGAFEVADSVSMGLDAPWLAADEPRIVPRALDGEHAGLPRMLVIVGIAIGLLAMFVLALTSASILSADFKDSGHAVVEKQP